MIKYIYKLILNDCDCHQLFYAVLSVLKFKDLLLANSEGNETHIQRYVEVSIKYFLFCTFNGHLKVILTKLQDFCALNIKIYGLIQTKR